METTVKQPSHIPPAAFSNTELTALRNDTPGCANVIHLNNAGASLMPEPVRQSIVEHINLEAAIGGYEAAALREASIKGFYTQAARLINSKAYNIAFTASATDSYTRALSSIPFKPGDVILTTQDDFISNQIQFLSCHKRFGIRLERIKNAPEGGVDLHDLDHKLKTLHPRLLAITHIPTNAGLVQPVLAIGKIAAQYEATYYLLDACQSIGQMKLDVAELKCDFLSVTNRKFLRGPRGTGFLYISDRALADGLEPLFLDMRGAEWIEKDLYKQHSDATRFEDWEFAYALVEGSRQAIEYCLQLGEDRIWQCVKDLSGYLRQELAEIPDVRVLDRGPEVCGLVTFTVAGQDPGYLTQQLLQRKINVVASYRNFAVMDFDEKKVSWALRASPHYFNTVGEIVTFIDHLKQVI
jgi:selenocysteine lyase/cysteine desulfurase